MSIEEILINMNYVELDHFEKKLNQVRSQCQKLKQKAIKEEAIWSMLRYYSPKKDKEIVIPNCEFGYHLPTESLFIRTADTKQLLPTFNYKGIICFKVPEYKNENGDFKTNISIMKLKTAIYYSTKEEYLEYCDKNELRKEYLQKGKLSEKQQVYIEYGFLTEEEAIKMNLPDTYYKKE